MTLDTSGRRRLHHQGIIPSTPTATPTPKAASTISTWGARVVDAFAGSGALGIEALSSGAEHCTFIERDREALEVLQENLETLGLTDRSTVVRGDVMTNIALVRNVSLVLADPPYEFAKWGQFLAEVGCDLVVAESDRDMNDEMSGKSPAITGWEVTRVKRYGRAYVSFLQRLA